jgi:hypothetical protein
MSKTFHPYQMLHGPHTVAVLVPAIYAEFGLTGVKTGLAKLESTGEDLKEMVLLRFYWSRR